MALLGQLERPATTPGCGSNPGHTEQTNFGFGEGRRDGKFLALNRGEAMPPEGVGDMAVRMQVKLLRATQQRSNMTFRAMFGSWKARAWSLFQNALGRPEDKDARSTDGPSA